MSLKQQDHNKAIEPYDAIRCEFRQIGIHNVIDYNQQRKNHNINSLLIGSKLNPLRSYNFALIDSEILQARYIHDRKYSGDIVFQVYQIDTNVYAEELTFTTLPLLQQMCPSLACLQMKRFPNKWTSTGIGKLTRIGVNSPQDLARQITNKSNNRRLKDLGESGF